MLPISSTSAASSGQRCPPRYAVAAVEPCSDSSRLEVTTHGALVRPVHRVDAEAGGPRDDSNLSRLPDARRSPVDPRGRARPRHRVLPPALCPAFSCVAMVLECISTRCPAASHLAHCRIGMRRGPPGRAMAVTASAAAMRGNSPLSARTKHLSTSRREPPRRVGESSGAALQNWQRAVCAQLSSVPWTTRSPAGASPCDRGGY